MGSRISACGEGNGLFQPTDCLSIQGQSLPIGTFSARELEQGILPSHLATKIDDVTATSLIPCVVQAKKELQARIKILESEQILRARIKHTEEFNERIDRYIAAQQETADCPPGAAMATVSDQPFDQDDYVQVCRLNHMRFHDVCYHDVIPESVPPCFLTYQGSYYDDFACLDHDAEVFRGEVDVEVDDYSDTKPPIVLYLQPALLTKEQMQRGKIEFKASTLSGELKKYEIPFNFLEILQAQRKINDLKLAERKQQLADSGKSPEELQKCQELVSRIDDYLNMIWKNPTLRPQLGEEGEMRAAWPEIYPRV